MKQCLIAFLLIINMLLSCGEKKIPDGIYVCEDGPIYAIDILNSNHTAKIYILQNYSSGMPKETVENLKNFEIYFNSKFDYTDQGIILKDIESNISPWDRDKTVDGVFENNTLKINCENLQRQFFGVMRCQMETYSFTRQNGVE